MKLLDCLLDAFPLKGGTSISQKEKYSSLEIRYEVIFQSAIKIENIELIIEQIHPNDSWTITVSVENFDPISLSNKINNVSEFVSKLNRQIENIEAEPIKLIASIYKQNKGYINIYEFDLFDEFVRERGPIWFLKVINDDLKKFEKLYFNVLDDKFEEFYTLNIRFGNHPAKIEESCFFDIQRVRENCHFGNQDEFPYSPTHFKLIKRPESHNNTTITFDSLSFIFAIICIFDITTISDNELNYKLNGYKTIEGKIHYDRLPLESTDTYLKIFEWVYSEPSNTSDKIGLARNILSIYLDDDSLSIQESAFFSLQSGFKTYLQENINRYIEVRNRIGEQLLELTRRANSLTDDYLNNFQKSILTFITFFVSVLLIRVLVTGKFRDVFTKDATIIAFALLTISFIYMLFLCSVLYHEKNRLIEKYSNLKHRFQDLLIEEDINKILRNDEEFNDEIRSFNYRQKLYTTLWILTIIVFLIVTIILSTYFDWDFFITVIKEMV